MKILHLIGLIQNYLIGDNKNQITKNGYTASLIPIFEISGSSI